MFEIPKIDYEVLPVEGTPEEEKVSARDKALRRVRALLARAEHPKTDPAEAEAAFARAAALMLQFGIDDAMREHKTVTDRDVIRKVVKVGAPYAKEKRYLLHVLAEHNSLETVALIPRTSRGYETYAKGIDVDMFGLPGDLERLEILYTSLLVQADRDLLRARPLDPFEDMATFRSSWLLGFAGGIFARLEEIRRRLAADNDQAGGTGTALVLADRKALAKHAAALAHPNTTKSNLRSSGSGRRAGREAAQRADLGQHRFNSGGRAELPAKQ